MEIPSLPRAATQQPTEEPASAFRRRHYRIFADYGTDFIWLNRGDPEYDSNDSSYIEAEDALSELPPAVLENYDARVDTYTTSFKRRCEVTGDYHARVFASVTEEVSWNIAGHLLALRIAMAPPVGSVEFSVGRGKYLLQKGRDTANDVTNAFLKDQARLLKGGKSTE